MNRRPLMASRFGFEPLEDRQMLAGYFDSIANHVTGPAGAMANITTLLRAIDSATRLPLINRSIDPIGQVTDSLESLSNAASQQSPVPGLDEVNNPNSNHDL